MSTAPNVTVIPAKVQTAESRDKYHQLRVAAYCRVSTELEEQQNSYQVQIAYYTDLINKKKEWTLAGIFADEGISGTQTKKRTEFNRMIRMCKNKKIDLVITKSISRFARNTVDCLEYVRQLKDLGIGVIFEKENINTLTMTSEFMISLYGSWFCQYHLTHFIRTRIMQRERYDHSRAFFELPEAAHRWRCRFFCWPSNS